MLKPNTFESAGNQAIRLNMLAKDLPYSLCMNAPCMTVITINKVQHIYNTPVYNTVPQELSALNQYLVEKQNINLQHYSQT